MLEGVILLWFLEVALAVAFVAWDIRRTPESTVMKWGFIVVTAYSGLFGALLYTLACREPLPGTHEAYVAHRWRQVVGSTMHCVAGDGIGILVAAATLAPLHLPTIVDLVAEYAVGFAFGWTIFQALFMRGMVGGSYTRSLRNTFLPELLSMNGVMAAMAAVSVPWKGALAAATRPSSPDFWFVMSIALCAGFLVAYPINWWLVVRGLKHGMTTIMPDGEVPSLAAGLALAGAALAHGAHSGHDMEVDRGMSRSKPHAAVSALQSHAMSAMSRDHHHQAITPRRELAAMVGVSFVILAAGVAAAAGLSGHLLGA
jgi:hypothetical protein